MKIEEFNRRWTGFTQMEERDSKFHPLYLRLYALGCILSICG